MRCEMGNAVDLIRSRVSVRKPRYRDLDDLTRPNVDFDDAAASEQSEASRDRH